MTSYDAVHYPSRPFAASRLDHMAFMARAFGLRPAPPHGARVLEIACATGGNILPLAQAFPGARFVGIDLAESQIAIARDRATRAGITNVELEARDLGDLDDSYGSFDYIIAHGLFSWVPDRVRARLIEVIAARLHPDGVAIMSHDTKPGWFGKKAVRDMLLYHLRHVTEPRARFEQAKALLTFVAGAVPADNPAWKSTLDRYLEEMKLAREAVAVHEILGEENQGYFLFEVAAGLEAVGLMYLCDADFRLLMPFGVPGKSARALRSMDPFLREQTLDFMSNRPFRCTLIVRDSAPIRRELKPEVLFDMWLSSSAEPKEEGHLKDDVPVRFETTLASCRVTSPRMKALLLALRQRFPGRLSFAELCGSADRAALADEIFPFILARIVEPWLYPAPFLVTPPERPRASPLARLHLEFDDLVPTLRHEMARLTPDQSALLALLDGSRDLAALRAALPGRDVPVLLDDLGRLSLLVP